MVEWRDIEGYEECYQVSDLGEVRSLTRVRPLRSRSGSMTVKVFQGCLMKTGINNSGYELAYLCKNSKRKALTVHRLVAKAFIPNPSDLPEVNHKDGDKLNNRVSNLEWSSISDNRKHAYDTGLQPNKVFKNAKTNQEARII